MLENKRMWKILKKSRIESQIPLVSTNKIHENTLITLLMYFFVLTYKNSNKKGIINLNCIYYK